MCGPASLKMVLDYYGINKSEQELSTMLNTNSELGTNLKDIKRVAEELNFKAEIQNESSFDEINIWLNKKVPVIVDWFSRGLSNSSVSDGHYSLVIGLNNEHIYLLDPEIGAERVLKRDDFLRVWFDYEGLYPQKEEMIIRQLIAVYPN